MSSVRKPPSRASGTMMPERKSGLRGVFWEGAMVVVVVGVGVGGGRGWCLEEEVGGGGGTWPRIEGEGVGEVKEE